jgi:hypothetical protein
MAKLVLIDHQPISVNPGTRSFEAAVDQPGSLVVRLARKTTATPTLWADGVSVSLVVEWSTDAGASWRDLGGFNADGGIAFLISGGEAPETVMQCPFPDATNRIRATATVSGARLESVLTIERV